MVSRKHLLVACALSLLLVLAAVGSGVTYARYRDAVQQDMTFSVKTLTEHGAFHLTSTNGWQSTENGTALTFSLTFEGTAAQIPPARLRLTATEALSPGVQVTLTVGDNTYTATPQPIAEGSALYTQMGAGYEFCFTDENGERSWQTGATIRLTVTGSSDAALLRLTVEEA